MVGLGCVVGLGLATRLPFARSVGSSEVLLLLKIFCNIP